MSFKMTRTAVAVSAAILTFSAGSALASEASLGDGPIRIVMPYGAGGSTDITARIIAANAAEHCGSRIDVVSMPGAGGMEGLQFVADAEPNGHTILMADYSATITQTLTEDTPWEVEDWVPIVHLTDWKPTVYVKADHEIQSIEDWIEKAEAEPNTLVFGHADPLSLVHLPLVMLEQETGIQNVHLPTTGGGETRTMILGGHIDLGMTLPPSIVSNVNNGEVTAIGVFADERSDVLPDVPTFQEAGYDVSLEAPLLVYTFSSVPESIQQQLSECIMTGLETDTAQAMGRQASAGLENVQGLESAQEIYRETTERVREVLASIDEG
ncbi:Bug family tripartite tricarboxylate transporter substrate binding protein [Billgrantia kenyensis]|uniref:Tripartite tricarboxylate transporter substrate binding protein n=1 Tax=Billgrantia kenyensis TaxID=321266 RepID=A0A7V9W0Z4_9GAMM|nr:tripartite tricarboxylate transporter substrate binding protein [Halomonas kenyensis]MBA2779023.1 tripartite tricarboxylate transporter substrate binding protein [Halomonas kenyensis]MCG6660450.1 tripartite tricarboxylate transporter substrate binding protein [Halomonas kenyensis]